MSPPDCTGKAPVLTAPVLSSVTLPGELELSIPVIASTPVFTSWKSPLVVLMASSPVTVLAFASKVPPELTVFSKAALMAAVPVSWMAPSAAVKLTLPLVLSLPVESEMPWPALMVIAPLTAVRLAATLIVLAPFALSPMAPLPAVLMSPLTAMLPLLTTETPPEA